MINFATDRSQSSSRLQMTPAVGHRPYPQLSFLTFAACRLRLYKESQQRQVADLTPFQHGHGCPGSSPNVLLSLDSYVFLSVNAVLVILIPRAHFFLFSQTRRACARERETRQKTATSSRLTKSSPTPTSTYIRTQLRPKPRFSVAA